MYIGNTPVVNASRLVTEVVAVQGQSIFYPAGGYTPGALDVQVNGLSLPGDDFTATDGASVVLAQSCGLGDVVRFVAFGTFNVANSYTAAQINAKIGNASSVSMRNRIINGDMRIDQRNAGASVTITNTAAVTYTLDRWAAYGSQASKFSVQQNAASVTLPAGYSNYLGATSLSAYSVGSSDNFTITQNIEGFNVADLGWGAAGAQTVTMSFWVRSSLTGTFGGALVNSAINRSYPFSYTISAANTWEQKTVTIAGDTSGTWVTNNGVGIRVIFGLGVGSSGSGTAGAWAGALYQSATGAVSVVGTNGATFYITGVQLEAGTVASPFERRDYGRELMMCQRYYEVLNSDSSSSGAIIVYGASMWAAWQFKVVKRAAPTISGFVSSFSGASPESARADGATGIYGSFGYSGAAYGPARASAEL